jgi:N-acetylglucosaminyldiphosphoundecaprenol N-acetyl-beta-D-mannosaminyltransferase
MITSEVKQTNVFGIPITCFGSYENATDLIFQRIQQNQKTFCVAINPEKICFAQSDMNFAEQLRKAHIHICDGVGTAVAIRLINGWRIPRITGVGLFFRLLEVAKHEHLGVFLLGAKRETNDKIYDVLRSEYPGLRIAGRHHGFLNDADEVIKQINASRADMLFVAMGSPRQERWLDQHMKSLDIPFCMGVGGSFDILSGDVKRAPKIFQRTGTEFLYRLACQPWRWRRDILLLGFAFRVFAAASIARGLGVFVKTMELRHIKHQGGNSRGLVR